MSMAIKIIFSSIVLQTLQGAMAQQDCSMLASHAPGPQGKEDYNRMKINSFEVRPVYRVKIN